MPVNRVRPPNHIHAAALAGPHDGADFDNLAVAGQLNRRAEFDQPAHARPIAKRGIAGDPDRWQVATDRLDLCRDAQIAPRQKRRLPHITQLLRALRLDQLKRAAKILIRRNECGVDRVGICIRSRGSIPA